MRLHFLQHVWFEDLGVIKNWAEQNNLTVTRTAFYENEPLPSTGSIDWLVIMGGSMNIYEYDKFPWLKPEKEFIKKAIKAGKQVLGICLGAQLIADVLGAKVYNNQYKEIGWFQLRKVLPALDMFPNEFIGFHWHSDTFDIPEDCLRIAETEACPNQGFVSKDENVLALQFHLEIKKEGIEKLVGKCGDEIIEAKFIQDKESILLPKRYITKSNDLMIKLLNNIKDKTRR